jgi:hypothetical protein
MTELHVFREYRVMSAEAVQKLEVFQEAFVVSVPQ